MDSSGGTDLSPPPIFGKVSELKIRKCLFSACIPWETALPSTTTIKYPFGVHEHKNQITEN
jgi:hypothetical protein